MTDTELIAGLEELRNTMVAVATGGPRIDAVNDGYQRTFANVLAELARRRIEHSLTYGSLWDWYGRWSSGDLPSYQSRREFVAGLFGPLLNQIRTGRREEIPPTGWQRVDRTVGDARDQLASGSREEHYQTVGLLCRETIISLAQAVYDPTKHPSPDGTDPSDTDAKRMLEAYVANELAGGGNEEARKHARSALALAVALKHRRTATFRDAALCLEATTSVVNLIAIVAGRRDPRPP